MTSQHKTDNDTCAMLAQQETMSDEKKEFAEAYVTPADFPTEQQLATLRRVPGKIALCAFLITFLEFAERFSYYGSTVLFTNFIQQPLPLGSTTGAGHQPGALGLGQKASFGLITFNTFWIFLTPLAGAYIADTYLGRFRTLCWAVAIAVVGHVLLITSSLPSLITSPNTSLAVFIVAIVVMGLGTGAFKANVSPLVAEQLDHAMHLRIERNGETVIVDPALTVSRVYMYFYLMINLGALAGQIGMVMVEKEHGFYLAFLLPTIVLLLCPLILFFGRNQYITSPPNGSVLSSALRILRFSAHGKWNSLKALRAKDFWDTAKPSTIPSEMRPAWMTFDDQFVDEVSRGFKACTVFLFYPLYWLTYNQLNSNLTSQAAVLRLNGLPNDLISNLDPITLVILIPILDLFVYPALRKRGIVFSPIKKITAGFATAGFSMIWAAVIQNYIYTHSECGYSAATPGCEPVDLLVWAQTGSYFLIALSEIFASVAGLEYAFTKAPKSMRSLVMSVFLFQSAIASALGEALMPLSADPLLVWNYVTAAVIALVASVAFWFTFRDLDAAEDTLNALVAGNVVFVEKEVLTIVDTDQKTM